MSVKRSSRSMEQISSAMNKYINRRRLDTKRARSVSVVEMASRSMLASATSTANLITFSSTTIDISLAENQYTGFKFWISESEDFYKPELAQLLYPLFTHLYLSLLINCASPVQQTPSPAHRFHKRHMATFLGNPEFKQFIQQLAEINSPEELDQNPAIASFRAAKYAVTLTERTYKYLVRYLESNESGLLLQILNHGVEIFIGDPLGAGSKQEVRAGMQQDEKEINEEDQEITRLQEIIDAVKDSSPTIPSIAMYKVRCEDGLLCCGASDEKGNVLCLGGGDSAVRLIDIQPCEENRTLDVTSSSIKLGCDSDISGSSRLQLPEGTPKSLRGHSGPVYGVDWLWDGGLLSCSEDKTIRVWDRETGAGLCALRGHNYPVWCVKGDRLGMKFASGSLDRTLKLWMPELSYPLRVYVGHDGSVDTVAWHPNCSYVLSGSYDKTVRMWSYQDSRCVRVFPAGKGGITDIACSPDGKYCASVGEDRKVRIWDIAMGTALKDLKGHLGDVTNVVWGHDSRLLISGSNEGMIKVWDTGSGEADPCLGSFSCGVGTSVLGMNFSDTNTLIVTAIDTTTGIQ